MAGLLHSDPALLEHWGIWDRFLESRPDAGFRQSSWWAAFHPPELEPAFGAVTRRGGIILGGGVVYRRKWEERYAAYLIPDGPVLPPRAQSSAQVMSALVQAVRAHRRREDVAITHLRIAPRWRELPEHLRALAPQAVAEDPAFSPREVVTIDLRNSETGILARMSPESRADIALARRFGVTVTEDSTPQGVDELCAMAGRVDDGTLAPLVAYLQARGQGGLLSVEDQGSRLAAALWVRSGTSATTLLGAEWHRGRQVIGPTLLQFEIMRRAKGAGCASYELPWNPLSDRLGGVRTSFTPVVDIVLDPAGYELFQALGAS